jgi:hypothetical protein
MMDPSVLTSEFYVDALRQLYPERRISVPATLIKAIDNNVVDEVLRYFIWPTTRYYRLTPSYLEKILELKRREYFQIYEYKKEYVREIIGLLERLVLPRYVERYVKDILLEEYSFLKENSALLLRFKRTIHYFKSLEVSTLDVTNKIKDQKENIFRRVRGLRWIVAVLLSTSEFRDLTHEPLWRLIGASGFILVVFDP